MLELFSKGGLFMWFISAVSMVGFTVILERIYTLYFRYGTNTNSLMSGIIGAVDSGQYQRALSLCNQRGNSPICYVLKAGLTKANRSDKEIQRAMEEEILRRAPKIQARVGSLSMLSNISTLLGLLGTIFGLIAAFKGVGLADAALKQQALAKGISIAMFTTAFGLIVAIPLMVAYHWIQTKANKMVDMIQESAVTLLNHLSAVNRDKFESRKKVSRVA